jgi:hypothetical protein
MQAKTRQMGEVMFEATHMPASTLFTELMVLLHLKCTYFTKSNFT